MKTSGIIITMVSIALFFGAYTLYSDSPSLEIINETDMASYSSSPSDLNEISPTSGLDMDMDDAITYSSEIIEDITMDSMSKSESMMDCMINNTQETCIKKMKEIGE